MCGILAAISADVPGTSRQINDFICQGLQVGTVRGIDSTGLFTVSTVSPNKASYFKRSVDGFDFLRMSAPRDMLSRVNNKVLVGHNRAATRGKVSANNAHPFEHKHIIGVHNGTLHNNNGLTWKEEFEVDSEAIFYSLSIANDTRDVISKLFGAFALIWYDTKEGMVHVVRNKDRTLFFGLHKGAKDKYTMLLASEAGMLGWLAERNKFTLVGINAFEVGVEYIIDPDKPEQFETITHKLYVPKVQPNVGSNFSLPKPVSKLAAEGLDSNSRIEFMAKKFLPYRSGNKLGKYQEYGCVHGFMVEEPFSPIRVHGVTYDTYNNWLKSDSLLSKPISVEYEKNEVVVILTSLEVLVTTLKSKYTDSGGNSVTEARWRLLVGSGCSNCTDNLLTPNDVAWTNNGDPLCIDCSIYFKSRESA